MKSTKLERCAFCGGKPTLHQMCKRCFSTSTSAGLARRLLNRVNRIAEADMLKGNPITGAHHRAIRKILKELK